MYVWTYVCMLTIDRTTDNVKQKLLIHYTINQADIHSFIQNRMKYEFNK